MRLPTQSTMGLEPWQLLISVAITINLVEIISFLSLGTEQHSD